ncbi:Cys-tRNA(Pro) deacylase [Thiopseudomonas acetoxidans]|jgi:Cys-tRNA(Pro)/Cys-tRNA(Cys) deacylase|uniref:Cys-tRNA(Pro)/Cys-tRNA(Cys) deacylase n=1 Tax=Thiopseudomonas acetoxidans TaxID=3041622 RepID=A0ABT7SQ76_9GAMM|nr:Cys-tRNA(Pro) deacylase [Thiopseudomonas sp. CY1220]MDM7858154.1 Cys-tRNA(Pro) deacylase [Thiopseudomonas sp. CY1220]NLC09257.1 Cys-tRNA(Pro) deacylase [Gammaproteobacteria bacterium]
MTPAINLLKKKKINYQIHSYEHDPRAASYGLEAAEKLALDPARVFKTLLVQTEAKELLVAILPVKNSLNLKQLASAAKVKKLEMADPQQAQRTTGYLLGGISPLGQKKALRTFVDQSAADFATIFVSAGRRGLEIELQADDLLQLTAGVSAEITA